ncbi:MAG: hypothetical protein VSS75_013895 [Candidatus Parabeggiatoa sp.]|nr:hypothetical protein [Candidatus Parabeggiatoa sp.]
MKVFLFVLLSFYFVNVLGIETDLIVKLDKTEVKPGQAFTLELTAINPLYKTVPGGITVSFSSEVEVVEKDEESIEYGIGSKVYCVGHISCVEPTKEMMVENWYNQWLSGEEKTMNLTVKATETGTLKIYARAAFIENLKKKQVINIPLDVTDQQGYPAHVRYLSVKNVLSDDSGTHTVSTQAVLPTAPRPPLPAGKVDYDKIERLEPQINPSVSFEVRIINGVMAYKYSDPFYEKLDDTLHFFGIGGAVNFSNRPLLGDVSIDVYGQRSDQGQDSFFLRDDNLQHRNVNIGFQRDDFAFTVGHQNKTISRFLQKITKRNSRVSFFWGYKWSKTDIDATTIILETGELTRDEIKFKTQGGVIGLGYTQPWLQKNNKHQIGVYLAYGRLNGDYKFSSFVGDNLFGSNNFVNPTPALRYGVSANGLLTKEFFIGGKLIYNLSFDYYSYTMDLAGNFGSLKEDMYNLSGSLNWVFDFDF